MFQQRRLPKQKNKAQKNKKQTMDRLAAANLRLLSPVGSLRLAISASMSLIFSRFISSLLLNSSISSSKACVRETKK